MSTKPDYDPDRLEYPVSIAAQIGLSKNEISYLKNKGCLFYGKKTTIRWVRECLEEQARLQAGYPPREL
jgi:hypothetical protein